VTLLSEVNGLWEQLNDEDFNTLNDAYTLDTDFEEIVSKFIEFKHNVNKNV
jgi:hypothetical protein